MQDNSNLSVLIVDPNPGMRGQLHNMLVQANITKVEFAQSSGTAIRQLMKRSYDIILCEYDLGSQEDGQDGQQLLEDLRLHKLIGLWTIFIMITSEGIYSKVISAAELVPTDYILKPFTVDVLSARIQRAIERRMAFLPTYQLIGQGNLREAIKSCASGEANMPRYAVEFAKLRAELHMSLEEYAEAEEMYRNILATKPIGWAHLGLARAMIAQGRSLDAQAELVRLTTENPKFMAAYDLLATCYKTNGDVQAAQRTLETAVSISPHVVRRLRVLGDTALESGDFGMAEKSFKQVLIKARYSEFRNPEDHVNLVRTLVARNDNVQAAATIRDLERSLRGVASVDVCKAISTALMQEANGNIDAAVEQLQAAAAGMKTAEGLSTRLRLDLAKSCLDYSLDEEATAVVMNVMADPNSEMPAPQAVQFFVKHGREDLAETINSHLKAQVAELMAKAEDRSKTGDHKGATQAMLEALHMQPGNLQVLFAASRIFLRQIDAMGWDHTLAERIYGDIDTIKRIDAHNDKLPKLEEEFEAVRRKYGIGV
ncbi:response regulator [Massilia sp. TS11]|nr:response regulator [Massilia sp. TS11]